MPKRKPNESLKKYVARAIPILRHEGVPQKEAVGRAFGMGRHQAKKRNRKKKDKHGH